MGSAVETERKAGAEGAWFRVPPLVWRACQSRRVASLQSDSASSSFIHPSDEAGEMDNAILSLARIGCLFSRLEILLRKNLKYKLLLTLDFMDFIEAQSQMF